MFSVFVQSDCKLEKLNSKLCSYCEKNYTFQMFLHNVLRNVSGLPAHWIFIYQGLRAEKRNVAYCCMALPHVPGLYIKEEIGSTKIKPIFSICSKICKDNVCIFCGLLLKKNLGNPKQKKTNWIWSIKEMRSDKLKSYYFHLVHMCQELIFNLYNIFISPDFLLFL